MKTQSKKYPVINIPNTLSLIRILVIVPMSYYFVKDELWPAFILLVISGLSDALDGFFARKLNQVTELGKMLDPLSDKLTQVAAAICIAIKFPSLVFILMVFVVKELLMAAGAFVLLKKHKKPSASHWYGKIATVLFYVAVGAIVIMDGFFTLDPKVFYIISGTLLGITAVAMVYAMFRYSLIFFSILRSEDPKDSIDIRSTITGRSEQVQ